MKQSLTLIERKYVASRVDGNTQAESAKMAGALKRSKGKGRARDQVKGKGGPDYANAGHFLEHRPHVAAALATAMVEAAREFEEDLKVSRGWIIEKMMTTINLAQIQDNHSAVIRGCEILGRHLGMWTVEEEDKRNLDDHVPLEDRLAGYLREESIDTSPNVERMHSNGSTNGAGGNGAA